MNKKRFRERFEKRIPARWHMTFMCGTTIVCGTLFSKMLLHFRFSLPIARYGLSVAFSYLVFFFLVYWWLRWHFGKRTDRRSQTRSQSSGFDNLDLTDGAINLESGPTDWGGGGGQFSGGGASGSWASDEVAIAASSKSTSSSSSSSWGVDLDEGVVIVLLLAVIAAISGSAIYLIYQAPEILSEAAFEILLVAGLFKKGKKIQAEGWSYSILRHTWIPFAIVLVMAMAFGFVIRYQCPTAISFGEYRALCGDKTRN